MLVSARNAPVAKSAKGTTPDVLEVPLGVCDVRNIALGPHHGIVVGFEEDRQHLIQQRLEGASAACACPQYKPLHACISQCMISCTQDIICLSHAFAHGRGARGAGRKRHYDGQHGADHRRQHSAHKTPSRRALRQTGPRYLAWDDCVPKWSVLRNECLLLQLTRVSCAPLVTDLCHNLVPVDFEGGDPYPDELDDHNMHYAEGELRARPLAEGVT